MTKPGLSGDEKKKSSIADRREGYQEIKKTKRIREKRK